MYTSDEYLKCIGRTEFCAEEVGYYLSGRSSTKPNGECSFLAPLQSKMFSALDPALTLSLSQERADKECPSLRECVADTIKNEYWQSFQEDYCNHVSGLRAALTPLPANWSERPSAVQVLDAIRRPIQKGELMVPAAASYYCSVHRFSVFTLPAGGIWGGLLTMRAVAIYLERPILVVYSDGKRYPVFFPNKRCRLAHTKRRLEALICCQKDGKPAVPSEAFQTKCLVVMFDGQCHFWCTKPSMWKQGKNNLDSLQKHLNELRMACKMPILDIVFE